MYNLYLSQSIYSTLEKVDLMIGINGYSTVEYNAKYLFREINWWQPFNSGLLILTLWKILNGLLAHWIPICSWIHLLHTCWNLMFSTLTVTIQQDKLQKIVLLLFTFIGIVVCVYSIVILCYKLYNEIRLH